MAVWARFVFVIVSLSLAAGTWQNVALYKPAWVSKASTFVHLPASNAVDGVTTANSFSYSAHTAVNESTAWWKVDLQKEVESAQVTIYFRTDYRTRRNGVQLYTSVTNSSDPKEGSLCHTVTGRPDGTDISAVLNVTCPGTWRYLTVYTETDNDGDGAVLDFVEVQVWTCTSEKYGPNCAIDCSSRYCKTASTTCDGRTGACPGGCEDGWTGIDCSRPCVDGMYGQGCNYSCRSRHCSTTSSNICNHVTGKCSDGCTRGFMGDDCLQSMLIVLINILT
ncbi:angiopoietin-1 receptor-like [Haliotis cracherodii]|uniref:angiopoietin-1 receptor-like n=1 Tax=Haliotis cracherodii TaxID=6455 RepID=UPI0039E833BE